ncbi:interleukin 17 [Octopus vulgaris]|uniref:Interleukin 17 n=1 Tax=Octopus vulgaris TaxID=6645 RepID=A0AA36AGW3_OCTVU|nr:interleukin 17 [Octopus vulgaris]
MKITTIVAQIVALLFNYNFEISSPSTWDGCERRADGKVRYLDMVRKSVGHNFFIPPEMVPPPECDPPKNVGIIHCSKFNSSARKLQEVANCPWYTRITHDPTIFPPYRREAVCSCKKCRNSSSNFQCVEVFSNITVLSRTNSQMTQYNSKKQADTAKKILERLSEFKSKIFLSDIFKTVNLLNLEPQGGKSDLVTCSQKIKGHDISKSKL